MQEQITMILIVLRLYRQALGLMSILKWINRPLMMFPYRIPTSLFFQRDPIPFKTRSAINETMLQFINNDTSGFVSNSTFSAYTFHFTHSNTYMLQQSHCSKSRFVRSTYLLTLIFTVNPAIVPTSKSREPPYITHSQISPMDFTI